MKFSETSLPGVILIEPDVFEDDRGFFFECWRKKEFGDAGIATEFVQDNHSGSHRGVLRGLHYQIQNPQGKLVRVVSGSVFDVAVDLRRSSPAFGQWAGVELSADNRNMLWIPPGFGHGFYVLSDYAESLYKCTTEYDPDSDRSIRWNDPQIGIDWPLPDDGQPIVSDKDAAAAFLQDAECCE